VPPPLLPPTYPPDPPVAFRERASPVVSAPRGSDAATASLRTRRGACSCSEWGPLTTYHLPPTIYHLLPTHPYVCSLCIQPPGGWCTGYAVLGCRALDSMASVTGKLRGPRGVCLKSPLYAPLLGAQIVHQGCTSGVPWVLRWVQGPGLHGLRHREAAGGDGDPGQPHAQVRVTLLDYCTTVLLYSSNVQ